MYGYRPRSPFTNKPKEPLTIKRSRDIIRHDIIKNSKIARDRQKHYYDRGRKEAEYYVGQPVLFRVHTTGHNQASKFAYKWDGPAIILKLPGLEENQPRYAILLDLKNSQCRSIALNHIKPYIGRQSYRETPPHDSNGDTSESEPDSPNEDLHKDESHIQDNTPQVRFDLSPEPSGNELLADYSRPLDNMVLDMDTYSDTSRPITQHNTAPEIANRRKQTLPRIDPPRMEYRPPTSTVNNHRDWLYRPVTNSSQSQPSSSPSNVEAQPIPSTC